VTPRWPARGLIIAVLCALGACAPNRAPVVERPVQDARPDPARDRGTTHQTTDAAKTSRTPPPVAPSRPPPVAPADGEDWRPDTYTVRQGDTLYAIALDHGHDYRDVAEWNALSDPNLIRVGQVLRVKAPAGWRERPDVPDADVRPMHTDAPIQATPLEPVAPPPFFQSPKAVKKPFSDRALAELRGVPYKPPAVVAPLPAPSAPPVASVPPPRPAAPASSPGTSASAAIPPAPAAVSESAPLPASAPPPGSWAWPTRGRLVQGFNSGANPKGIVIAGEAGQPVWASAPGKVVYSGSGLRGYGKLVIVKHDRNYLSVYAHNRELLVKEGEPVSKGQKIAEVGSSESGSVGLHFEIRKLGKPVDPLQYLAPL